MSPRRGPLQRLISKLSPRSSSRRSTTSKTGKFFDAVKNLFKPQPETPPPPPQPHAYNVPAVITVPQNSEGVYTDLEGISYVWDRNNPVQSYCRETFVATDIPQNPAANHIYVASPVVRDLHRSSDGAFTFKILTISREGAEPRELHFYGTPFQRISRPWFHSPMKMGTVSGKAPGEAKTEIKKPAKEHAPPPPSEVVEPLQDDGMPTTTYYSGKLLGKGGFAVCYEGKNVKSGQVFALKVVKSRMSQQRMADKFRTELQIHAKMHHPNIVNFFRAFAYQESTYVVLELCENGSVMDMVKRRKCLSLPEVRRLTIQLCGAVKYMHQRNVIHRDLKMGNLFLDNNMNIKVGDFGLAAILIDEKEAKKYRKLEKIRRTTMCGTPNYIAPEILEKQKFGHGHKVDIWAIGVICFAMLTGFPPFQSSSQEEIYRKVKSLEYVWPKDFDSSGNYIPKEAKDLVTSCLNLKPEDRPEPDDIVEHSFFKMYARCIPRTLDPICRVAKPMWLKVQDPRGDSMESAFAFDTNAAHDFYAKCGVGRDSYGKLLTCVGEKANKTASLECLEEEQSGQNPVVPIPEETIYSPDYKLDGKGNMIPLWGSEQGKIVDDSNEWAMTKSGETSTSALSTASAISASSIASSGVGTVRPTLPVRPAPQSHAATLRQQARLLPETRHERGTLTAGSRRKPLTSAPAQAVGLDADSRPPMGLLSRPSVRSSSRIASSGSVPQISQTEAPTLPRSQTIGDVRRDNLRRQRNVSTQASRPAPTEAKEGDGFVLDLLKVDGERQKNDENSRKDTTQAKQSSVKLPQASPSASILAPDEAFETIRHTTPDEVLAKLNVLLENMKVAAKDLEKSNRTRRQKQENPNHPAVHKWVDYTNKFGIGYILTDGTVGCLFRPTSNLPCSFVAVPAAEEHLRKKKIGDYPERHQLVPQAGPAVEFYEGSQEEGIKRVYIDARDFNTQQRVAQSIYNTSHYQEKLKRLSLWDKFGKYMTASLGKEEDEKLIAEAEKKKVGSKIFVKFYQRCGNVGIWGFGDGSFQFNFPDHTKLIIAAGGTWLDFSHLQIQDAIHMATHGTLAPNTFENRASLSGPTAQLKYLESVRPASKNVLAQNHFNQKMEWVCSIISRWIELGGLGELGETGKNKPGYTPTPGSRNSMGGYWFWEGARELVPPGKDILKGTGAAGEQTEKPKGWQEKLVWVSVGAPSGNDAPYEAIIRVVPKLGA